MARCDECKRLRAELAESVRGAKNLGRATELIKDLFRRYRDRVWAHTTQEVYDAIDRESGETFADEHGDEIGRLEQEYKPPLNGL